MIQVNFFGSLDVLDILRLAFNKEIQYLPSTPVCFQLLKSHQRRERHLCQANNSFPSACEDFSFVCIPVLAMEVIPSLRHENAVMIVKAAGTRVLQ